MEILKHKTINFDNVIKHLCYEAARYYSQIKQMEEAITTNKYDSQIQFEKKLLLEYESAIDCLKAKSENVTYTITKNGKGKL